MSNPDPDRFRGLVPEPGVSAHPWAGLKNRAGVCTPRAANRSYSPATRRGVDWCHPNRPPRRRRATSGKTSSERHERRRGSAPIPAHGDDLSTDDPARTGAVDPPEAKRPPTSGQRESASASCHASLGSSACKPIASASRSRSDVSAQYRRDRIRSLGAVLVWKLNCHASMGGSPIAVGCRADDAGVASGEGLPGRDGRVRAKTCLTVCCAGGFVAVTALSPVGSSGGGDSGSRPGHPMGPGKQWRGLSPPATASEGNPPAGGQPNRRAGLNDPLSNQRADARSGSEITREIALLIAQRHLTKTHA